jgi:hypothetical protein
MEGYRCIFLLLSTKFKQNTNYLKKEGVQKKNDCDELTTNRCDKKLSREDIFPKPGHRKKDVFCDDSLSLDVT